MSHQLHYVVKHKNGRVYEGQLGVDIRKTLDRRSDRDDAQIVYECRDGNRWIRVWTDECAGVTADLVKESPIILPPGVTA